MANPRIGYAAAWKAIREFAAAATGIPIALVYQSRQNQAELEGSPAACRIWSDNGLTPASSSWQKERSLLAEAWLVTVVAAQAGALYRIESLLAVPAFDHTAGVGETPADIRDALVAAAPAEMVAAPVGAAALTLTAAEAGQPLALLTPTPPERLTLTRTGQTAKQTAAIHAEMVVQFEIYAEVPRDDPDSVPQAIEFIGRIEGKLAQGQLGPYAALRKAGVYFMRYQMQAQDLTDLDRVVNRSRARVDVVFALDAADETEFDRVVDVQMPAGEVTV